MTYVQRYFLTTMVLGTSFLACGDDNGSSGGSDASVMDSSINRDSSADGAGGDGGSGTLHSYTLKLASMDPHVGEYMEFRLIAADNTLSSIVVLDTLPTAAYDVVLPKSYTDGTYRLDFFADHKSNHNRAFDAPPESTGDHAWRQEFTSNANVESTFTHNTNFTDISTPAFTGGKEFKLNTTGVTAAHPGKLFQLRVIKKSTGQVVGVYIAPSIPASGAFTPTIPGVIQDGAEYQIDFFADANGNGKYDAPSADHAWRRTATGTASGLTVDFTHDTTWVDVGF